MFITMTFRMFYPAAPCFSKCLGILYWMRDQQIFFSINESFAMKIRWSKSFTQVHCIFRTSLFTQATKNTAQHIDLVLCCIFLFPVQMFFAHFAFCRFHSYCFSGARHSTQTTGCASFTSCFIP